MSIMLYVYMPSMPDSSGVLGKPDMPVMLVCLCVE